MTGLQLYNLALHAVGSSVDSRHDVWLSVNMAGRRLLAEKPWSWRRVGPVNLAAVAGQNYIALPADFETPIGAPVPTTPGVVNLRSIEEVMRLRQSGTTGAANLYTVAFGQQNSPTGVPAPVLHLFPTPTANGSPTFQLVYLRQWIDLSAGNQNAAVPLPSQFDRALACAVRSQVRQFEEEDPGVDEKAYRDEVERLWSEDSARQISVTPVRGDASRLYDVPAGPWNEGGGFVGVMP